ncbi:MAG: single-stranded-DNA-specific exonuclease RecJ [Deltaproteobacteria bacterium]|nr:single-stranded-DNA-specific exonuclease RecJ [Deltaproteobacteria bacterium]
MPRRVREIERPQIAHRKIRVRPQDIQEAKKIAAASGLNVVASKVLAARGFKADKTLQNFIKPSLQSGLPSPEGIKNIAEACALVDDICKENGAIAICCDFDVDGLSGGAQMHHFFRSIGAVSKVFVPDRFEDGYGLNSNMVREIAKQGFALLLTIDYGTTNGKELELARSLGLKSIVIDHHHVSAPPPADVFINPNQEGCGFADRVLCASGLAWYFIAALRKCLKRAAKVDAKQYLDLACLGTICDMVPLSGANRIIAKRGLEMLSRSSRAGIVALRNVMGAHRELTCTDVSFGIGPRLNAAGRMVHAEVVIDLLTTEDSDRARRVAQQLNKLNAERQDTENSVKEQAVSLIMAQKSLNAGLVVAKADFHTGVVGIVAQRLVEHFYRPAVVLGMDSAGIFKGSVRGIKGFSVVEALASVGEHLEKFGGHEGAGGLSVKEEKLEDFSAAFIDECKRRLSGVELDPYVEADTEVELNEIEIPLVEQLKRFAPFGMGNPSPVLLVRDLKVLDVKVLKGAHLKAMLSDGQRFISGLMWRQSSHPALNAGSKVNVALRPDTNNFNGITELQGNIQAVEPA